MKDNDKPFTLRQGGKSEIQDKDMPIRSLSCKPCRPCKLCKPNIWFKTLQLIWYQKHKQCKLSKL